MRQGRSRNVREIDESGRKKYTNADCSLPTMERADKRDSFK